jgi:hypothetical protein
MNPNELLMGGDQKLYKNHYMAYNRFNFTTFI